MKTSFPVLILSLAASIGSFAPSLHADASRAPQSVGQEDQRQSILSNELATEKKALAAANAELSAAVASKLPADQIRSIAAKVVDHSNNIDALQRELGQAGSSAPKPRRAFVVKPSVSAPVQSTVGNDDAPYWDVYHRKQNQAPARGSVTRDIEESSATSNEEGASEPAD